MGGSDTEKGLENGRWNSVGRWEVRRGRGGVEDAATADYLNADGASRATCEDGTAHLHDTDLKKLRRLGVKRRWKKRSEIRR